ncbi:MAG: alpha/beta fold hydrolase [Caulobacteraceae bacterium]|nr:alpha/beta fold hydrolase [Caulobacteraceae bacterium]
MTAPMPVVFASGQLLTPAAWAPQARALADRPLVFADNRSDETIAGMAERLITAAPARFDLVAHAMGGFVAFEVMRRAPQRVRRLVLLATLAPADSPAQTARREGYLRLVEAGRFAEVVEERLPILLHPDRRANEALIGTVRAMAAETGAEAFLRQQRAIMSRPDARPGLSAIARPTLLVMGRQDGIVTQAHQDEILAAIPGARLEVVEDCGHLSTLERPQAVNALLAGFLAA